MKSLAVAALLIFTSVLALADVRATFLGSATYATRAGCVQLRTLAAGTPRNLNTVPETLDASGHRSWEGGCSIEKITERVAGKTWTVNLKCSEGAIENAKSTETWTKATDGSILVKAAGTTTRLYACQARGKP